MVAELRDVYGYEYKWTNGEKNGTSILKSWQFEYLTVNILLGVFSFWVKNNYFAGLSRCFLVCKPLFKKQNKKTMKYIGRSCSYGEGVLILQRKNKAFSFIFPCLMMMKPKSRRELLIYWVQVNWKRKMVLINWWNFWQAFAKEWSWRRMGKT